MMRCMFMLAALLGVCSPLAIVHAGEGLKNEGDFHVEAMRKEIATVVCSESMSVANLNLNRQGNVILARPGEKIFSTVNFACNTDCIDSNSLNQIIIGYENLGPRKCIFNELGYRCGEGIASFLLVAPKEPGSYDIQCCLEQAYSPVEAMQNWHSGDTVKLTIGRVVVR